jgi:hypothetical protein
MRRAKLFAVGAALVVLALAAGNQGQVGQAQQEVRTLSGHTCCVLSAQFGTGSTSTAKGYKSPLAPQLPQTLIVDDTVLQLGSRRIYLFLATDPERKMIVYAEPYAGRSQWDVEDFFQRIRRLYGRWPLRLVIVTDRGPWYRTVSVVLQALEHIRMEGFATISLFTQL